MTDHGSYTALASGEAVEGDAVRSIADAWRARLPDLDTSPMLVLGRIERLAALCHPLLRPPFARVGLAAGDFDVLAALCRSGPPHRLSHGDLARATLVTPGGLTKRIDRLSAKRLVTQTSDPADARGRLVTLTRAGQRLADKLIGEHLSNEAALLQVLDGGERDHLASLLGKLLLSVEGKSAG